MVPVRRDESWLVAESEAFGPEQLPVARTAVDFLVGAIACQHRVQGPMAFGAIEAFLMPHGALGELLFRGKHHATATGATLPSWRLNRGRIRIVVWSTGRNFFLPEGNQLGYSKISIDFKCNPFNHLIYFGRVHSLT